MILKHQPWALLLLLMTGCTSASTATPTVAITVTSTPISTAMPSRTVTATITPTASPTGTATSFTTATPLPTVTQPQPTMTPRPISGTLPPSPTPVQVAAEEQQVIDLINQIRSQNNLSILTMDARLMAAAEGHSLDMAQHNFFAHEGSDGSSVEHRLTRQGYAWNFYAEDLGCGYESPGAVVQGWLDSPPHRANVLAAEARQIGVGYVSDQGGDCGTYWTAVFAAGR